MPSVSITTSATKIVGADATRQSVIIQNEGSTTVYIGADNTVTASGTSATDGIGILPKGTFFEDSSGGRLWKGDIWGVVTSGTADLRYWERTSKL